MSLKGWDACFPTIIGSCERKDLLKNVQEILDSIDSVLPAIEIPDSRFLNFHKIGENLLIADNACAGEYVLGKNPIKSWKHIDLKSFKVDCYKNNQLVGYGLGSNVLGDPVKALTWLINELNLYNITLYAGQTILTGTCIKPFEVKEGDQVAVCIVSNRAYGHQYDTKLIEREQDACRKAKEVLSYHELFFLNLSDEQLDKSQIDLIVPLEELVLKQKPDLVYLPHRGDLNQDHRATFEAARVACRPFASHRPIALRAFEVPSSSDQVPATSEWPFLPNYYVSLDGFLDSKIKAMECYSKETRVFPHPRSPDGLRIYAKKRGMEVGIEAAEAFVVMRDGWW